MTQAILEDYLESYINMFFIVVSHRDLTAIRLENYNVMVSYQSVKQLDPSQPS